MMVKYVCDWCKREFPLNCITTVKLRNVYDKTYTYHICRDCGRSHMPDAAQPMLSWTDS